MNKIYRKTMDVLINGKPERLTLVDNNQGGQQWNTKENNSSHSFSSAMSFMTGSSFTTNGNTYKILNRY